MIHSATMTNTKSELCWFSVKISVKTMYHVDVKRWKPRFELFNYRKA